MRNEDSVYQDCDVELDGQAFLRCRFERCNLVYRGGALPVLDGCQILRSSFVLAGDAVRTRDFLRQIWVDAGMEGIVHTLGLDSISVGGRSGPH